MTVATANDASYHLMMMIIYASVALVFSFLCSVAEAVLLSMSVSYIANLEQAGKKIAGLLSKRQHTLVDWNGDGLMEIGSQCRVAEEVIHR